MLDDITFRAGDGALVGPTGADKTTQLWIIAGDLQRSWAATGWIKANE